MVRSPRFRTLLAIAAILTAIPAHASIFFVTRHDDPSPDGCVPDDCSLREAVLAANEHTGMQNTVVLGSGSFGLPGGPLVFDGEIRISGAGMDETTIEGNGEYAVLRATPGSSIYLQYVTVEGHDAHALDYSVNGTNILYEVRTRAGSEIWPTNAFGNVDGSMVVSNCELHAYLNASSMASVRMYDSRLRHVYLNELVVNHPQDVSLSRVVIDGDLEPGHGGGLLLAVSGDIELSHVTVQHTEAGMLIYESPQSAVIDHLLYLDNTMPLSLSVPASLAISDSEFRGNHNEATPNGPGALRAKSDGANVTIRNSSFIDNVGSGLAGGAVFVHEGASLNVINSTFSGNTFTAEAAADNARGAAIGYESHATVTGISLTHVTIVAPGFAPFGIQGSAIGGNGGGSGLSLGVFNSIVRGSCKLDANAMDMAVGNIESTGNTCAFPAATNQVSVSIADLALGAPGSNGGPTPTIMPGPSSVAINAADATFCYATDQRGYARPAGGECDAGSVEADSDVIFADDFG